MRLFTFPALLALSAIASTSASEVGSKSRRYGREPSQKTRDLGTTLQDEEKKGFLSIPQDDPDPTARARRLSYRAPYWEFVSYGSLDPGLANVSMAAAGGPLGSATNVAQGADVAGQLEVSTLEALKSTITPIAAECVKIAGFSFACLNHLTSYLPLYEALDPEYQPAAYKFWDSDYAFARERITSSPAFIKKVKSVNEIPFTQAQVTGYDQITGGTTLTELVAQGRLFMVDFYPLYLEGVLVTAPDSYLEASTAVFFLDGPIPKKTMGASKKDAPSLMPLAIKYNVQQQYVVSPKDNHADWFLAKASFNTQDGAVNAILHFVLHTAISNIAIAAQKNLASEHPLYRPIQQAAANNFGIIFTGVASLLQPGGTFDQYLSLSGESIEALLLPYFINRFNWQLTYLQEDLAARGVSDIPGFLYRDDAQALYNALYKYSEGYLSSSYKKHGTVQGDAELKGFLDALTSNSSTVAYLKGFPTSSETKTLKDVSKMLAQILWITGVQHHALNSFRILNYDLVYPSHPGKILSPLPPAKGTLTDDMVAQEYISGAALTATSAEAQVAYTNPDTIYVADMSALSIGPPIQFFVGTQGVARAFYPLLQKPNRLTNIYLSDMEDKRSAQVALRLRQDLREIGAAIIKREEANTDSPKYVLLDPAQLPFNLYI